MRRPTDRTGTTVRETGRPAQLDGFASDGFASPALRRSPSAPAVTPGRRVSAAETRASMRSAAMAEGASGFMASLMASDLRDAAPHRPEREGREGHEPTTPQTLPAVIGGAIAETGGGIDVRFHMVRNLPGYAASQIRALGRAVFAEHTDTPIDDIQIVSTLSNSEVEVKALMTWISRNGVRDDEVHMSFDGIMPGYTAETQVWNVEDMTFLLVKDMAGHYVYGWPGGRGVHLDAEPETPLLGPR